MLFSGSQLNLCLGPGRQRKAADDFLPCRQQAQVSVNQSKRQHGCYATNYRPQVCFAGNSLTHALHACLLYATDRGDCLCKGGLQTRGQSRVGKLGEVQAAGVRVRPSGQLQHLCINPCRLGMLRLLSAEGFNAGSAVDEGLCIFSEG